METLELLKRFEKLPMEIKDAAQKCAEKESVFRSLDNQSKNILSGIKMGLDSGESESKLERLAFASEEWRKHIDGLSFAQGEFLKSRAMLNGLETEHRTLQSIISYRKSEVNLI